MKFGIYDYVVEICSQTTFGKNRFSGGFWGNGWNITSEDFYFLLFFSQKPTGHTPRQILTKNGSYDADSRKDDTFGVKTPKMYNRPLFTPKKPYFWGTNRQFQAKTVECKNGDNLQTIKPINVKFLEHVRTVKYNTWVVLYDVTTNPRWRTAAILKIVKSPYLSQKSSDFAVIWYTASDVEPDYWHVTKNWNF